MTEKTKEAERRQAQRFQLRVPVAVLGLGNHASQDISETGVFIETHIAQPVGECMQLRLVHPQTGDAIAAVCQVVRQVHDDNGNLHGLGLRFANADANLTARIRQLIVDLIGNKTNDDDIDLNGVNDGEVDFEGLLIDLDEADVTKVHDDAEADNDIFDMVVVDARVEMPLADVPILWPDSKPTLVQTNLRRGLGAAEQRLLAFVDGNNTVSVIARIAGLGLEDALAELQDLSRCGVVISSPAPLDENSKVAETPAPLFPGRDAVVEEQARWRRARVLVGEALAAERGDNPQGAIALLQGAIELRPPNAASLNARAAIIAMRILGDFDLAEQHAQTATLDPRHRDLGQRLLREVKRRRRSHKRRHKNSPSRPQPKPKVKDTAVEKTVLRRQRMALWVAVAVLLGLGAWNFRRYLVPLLERPVTLATAGLEPSIPIDNARLYRGRIIVTFHDGWEILTEFDKAEDLAVLGHWAKTEHDADEVIAATRTPLLVGRVSHGRVTVYNPR